MRRHQTPGQSVPQHSSRRVLQGQPSAALAPPSPRQKSVSAPKGTRSSTIPAAQQTGHAAPCATTKTNTNSTASSTAHRAPCTARWARITAHRAPSATEATANNTYWTAPSTAHWASVHRALRTGHRALGTPSHGSQNQHSLDRAIEHRPLGTRREAQRTGQRPLGSLRHGGQTCGPHIYSPSPQKKQSKTLPTLQFLCEANMCSDKVLS